MTSLIDFPLRAEPEPEPGETAAPVTVADVPAGEPGPEPEVRPAPLVLLEGDRMTQGGRMLASFARVLRDARRSYADLAEREGSIVHGLMRGQPPSVQSQHEYARDRHWVPRGHDGGVIEGMGVIYHWLIGRPGVALANAAGALLSRPLRLAIGAVVVVLPATIAALLLAGHRAGAIATGAGAALLGALWVAAGYLFQRARGWLAVARTVTYVPAEDETEEES